MRIKNTKEQASEDKILDEVLIEVLTPSPEDKILDEVLAQVLAPQNDSETRAIPPQAQELIEKGEEQGGITLNKEYWIVIINDLDRQGKLGNLRLLKTGEEQGGINLNKGQWTAIINDLDRQGKLASLEVWETGGKQVGNREK